MQQCWRREFSDRTLRDLVVRVENFEDHSVVRTRSGERFEARHVVFCTGFKRAVMADLASVDYSVMNRTFLFDTMGDSANLIISKLVPNNNRIILRTNGFFPIDKAFFRPRGTPVLVVDDDPHARRHVRDALAAAGYAPAATGEPGQVARLVEAKHPALVLLDLVLPGVDGIELMRTLPALADLPVIFVSAYGRGDTVARALEAGAADYIVKPFSPAELVARVGLALRRRTAPAPFVLGDLAIDRAKPRVTVAGRPVRLTATEYRLLHALSLDAGGATS